MRSVKIDEKFNEKLNRDPVADVEKLFNKHHSEFNHEEGVMMLANAFHANETKRNYLKSLGDTHFSISWNEFIKIIESYGFKEGLKYDIEHNGYSDQKYVDEAALYYHPEKGLVIWATSYSNKTSLNSGTLYGQITTNEKVSYKTVKSEYWDTEYQQMEMSETLQKTYDSLFKCSHDAFADIETGVKFSYDVREALINKIEQIDKNSVFIKEWTKKPFLWFLDYNEEKIENYDYEAITKEKISKCPEELQNILKVYSQ